jgi:hypothetical protein
MAQEQLYLLKEDSLSQKDGDKTAGKCCLMAQNTIIEAGLEMEQILEKIKLYNPRQTVTIRVSSHRALTLSLTHHTCMTDLFIFFHSTSRACNTRWATLW